MHDTCSLMQIFQISDITYIAKLHEHLKLKKRNEALMVQPHKSKRMANQAKLASSETKGAAGFQRALSGTVLLGQRLNGRR